MDNTAENVETSAHHLEPAHPTPRKYVAIASILVAITAIEVGVFYLDVLKELLIAVFFVLSAVKFGLVVMFYMHLKFDSRLFSWFFITGLVLAAAMIITLMALFKFFV